MILDLIIMAALISALSGLPVLLTPADSRRGQQFSAALAVAGALLGIAGAVLSLMSEAQVGAFAWNWPSGAIQLRVDALSAAFLLSIHVISGLAAIYGLEYWPQAAHPVNGRKLRCFLGMMTAGMTFVVLAADGVTFLVAWEVMALAGYFLVTTESEKEEVQEAGWIYFVATHLSSLLLFAFFALYRLASGSYALLPLANGTLDPVLIHALFLLAVAGFGIKAGLFPLHVWLPSAHANAPSHVSALFSGVLIKLGVYGVMRACWLLPAPPVWWGGLLLILGVCSGIYGVVFAIGQHDLKRLLAYHSIENIGIIFMGLGLALLGQTYHEPAWVVLGMAGAVLHVWNHGLFKSLLFLGAGSVIHAVHTREIDHLGGLAKRMPWTSGFFMVGAAAICGLPPLNGFISELFIYLGLFQALGTQQAAAWPLAALAIPALGLIGALALACFAKVHGAVFLGEPRTPAAEQVHESGVGMLGPMALLAVLCCVIGLFPVLVAPALQTISATWAPELATSTTPLNTLAPLRILSILGPILLVVAAAIFAMLSYRARDARRVPRPTWDCGYVAPSARMQYTASSFAQMLVDLYHWLLLPQAKSPRIEDLFPTAAAFHSHVPDAVLDRAVNPVLQQTSHALARLRFLQQGRVQVYIVYVVVTLLVLMALI